MQPLWMTIAVRFAAAARCALSAGTGDTNFDRLSVSHCQLGFLPQAFGTLVSYIASMFLSRRLCTLYYVYFASLYDVCTQNELAFLRLCSGSGL